MAVEPAYSQTICGDEFIDELQGHAPLNLSDSADFPPLTTAATVDGWDCINSQETDDVVVTVDMEDWEQLELATKQSLTPEYCFATVAKQTEHVPAPIPTLVAPTVPINGPLKRRPKPAKEQVWNDEFDEGDLWDLYPSNKVEKKMHKAYARRRKQLLHCFDTIPTSTPQEPVITDPGLHRSCAYSSPLTDRQYKHAVFKHVQWDRRWMSYGKYFKQPDPIYRRPMRKEDAEATP